MSDDTGRWIPPEEELELAQYLLSVVEPLEDRPRGPELVALARDVLAYVAWIARAGSAKSSDDTRNGQQSELQKTVVAVGVPLRPIKLCGGPQRLRRGCLAGAAVSRSSATHVSLLTIADDPSNDTVPIVRVPSALSDGTQDGLIAARHGIDNTHSVATGAAGRIAISNEARQVAILASKTASSAANDSRLVGVMPPPAAQHAGKKPIDCE